MDENINPDLLKKNLGKKDNQIHTLVEGNKYHNEQFKKLVGLEYSQGTYKKIKSALVSLEKFIEWKLFKRFNIILQWELLKS